MLLIFGAFFSTIVIPQIKTAHAAPGDFISTWDTTKISGGSSANNKIHLPLEAAGTYDFVVDWGDLGPTSHITVWNQAETTHTYASTGIYTLNISGTITGWIFNNTGDRLKISQVSQFGTLRLGNSGRYFYGCSNLKITATDILDLTGTTIMSYAFASSGIDTVPSMNSWDVSSVTAMSYMFYGASSFNQDVSNWDVSSVTAMDQMFRLVSSFNQNIGNWNVANVTTMRNMFYGASSFNQDVSNWNVANVTDMTGMFDGVTLSTINYSNLLVGWSGLALKNNVVFAGGNSKYYMGAPATARAHMTDVHTWTITDGGAEAWPPASITTTSPSSYSIKIDWVSGGGQNKFNIYRGGESGVGTLIYSANGLTYTDIGLNPYTNYTYYVYSVNDGGIENSSFISVTGATQGTHGGGEDNETTLTPTTVDTATITELPQTGADFY